MKLSVVTVNRNNAAGLRATLESTFGAQNGFDDWEQIVVDGASTDGGFAEVDRYRGDPRLGWCVSEPDDGIFNAMNKGAAHARGDYLLFLNSGDTLLPGVLAKVFAEPWDADLAYGDVFFSRDGSDGLRVVEEPEDIVPAYFLFATLPHQATFVSASLHRKLGGYDEKLKIYGDRQFFLRCFLEGRPRLRRLRLTVSRWKWGGVSTSEANARARTSECEAMLTPYFGRFAVRSMLYRPSPDFWLDTGMLAPFRDDAAFPPFFRDVAAAACAFYREKPDRPVPGSGNHPTGPDDVRLAVEFLDAAAALRGRPRLALFVRHALHWLAARIRGKTATG